MQAPTHSPTPTPIHTHAHPHTHTHPDAPLLSPSHSSSPPPNRRRAHAAHITQSTNHARITAHAPSKAAHTHTRTHTARVPASRRGDTPPSLPSHSMSLRPRDRLPHALPTPPTAHPAHARTEAWPQPWHRMLEPRTPPNAFSTTEGGGAVSGDSWRGLGLGLGLGLGDV